MKVTLQHELRRNRNKLRKNYGWFLFLIGLLFMQGVYSSNVVLGLDEQQRETLEGLYVGIKLPREHEPPESSNIIRELTFSNSSWKFGPVSFVKQCDGHDQFQGSKFCWINDQGGRKLVLHDDDTLRIYIQNSTTPTFVLYKIDHPDQIDKESLKNEIFPRLKLPVNKTKTQNLGEKIQVDNDHFAELKELVSDIILPRKISPLLPTKNVPADAENVLADKPWYKKSYYLVGICVGVFMVAGLCCIVCCKNTSNEEIKPDADDPINYFPSTTDLVLEVQEHTTEQSTDTETMQYSLSVEHSNTDVTVTDSTINFGTQSSEVSEQSKSDVVSTLQFSEEASIVENTKSQSQSSELNTNQKKKTFPISNKET